MRPDTQINQGLPFRSLTSPNFQQQVSGLSQLEAMISRMVESALARTLLGKHPQTEALSAIKLSPMRKGVEDSVESLPIFEKFSQSQVAKNASQNIIQKMLSRSTSLVRPGVGQERQTPIAVGDTEHQFSFISKK